MGNFNKLEVWKDSRDLAIRIYKTTGTNNFSRDYSLRDQIRRAAISVPSNIAEGEESGSVKGSIRYFNIANASLAELKTQMEIAKEIGYLGGTDHNILQDSMIILSKRIKTLIKYRRNQL